MDKKSKADLFEELNQLHIQKLFSKKYYHIFINFFRCYEAEMDKAHIPESNYLPLFFTFLQLVKNELLHPHEFLPYHKKIRSPFDHYQFGIDFLKPLVDKSSSKVRGLENVKKMVDQLNQNENVILFANHQTESDPQAISILLENSYPEFASQIILVAGERVISDLFALPISLGCDLLCIYSKKYLDTQPELKEQRQQHNKKTMELMSRLLSEGGKVIFMAPSGGRDRPNKQGVIEVAPFDSKSIEMFYLMAKKGGKTSHFYPLALATYSLLPPPDTLQLEMGEHRRTQRGSIHIGFGPEIDMEHFSSAPVIDKMEKRKLRAEYIHSLVKKEYEALLGDSK
ncbi:MAG: 1-acyl-sn-glycerol-3-phosphate acyltransferase [Chlamydiota bacterium]